MGELVILSMLLIGRGIFSHCTCCLPWCHCGRSYCAASLDRRIWHFVDNTFVWAFYGEGASALRVVALMLYAQNDVNLFRLICAVSSMFFFFCYIFRGIVMARSALLFSLPNVVFGPYLFSFYWSMPCWWFFLCRAWRAYIGNITGDFSKCVVLIQVAPQCECDRLLYFGHLFYVLSHV